MSETNLPERYLKTLSFYETSEESDHRPGTRNIASLQHKELSDMYRRFQNSEAFFSEAYTKLTTLEKAIASCEKNWHN